MHLLSENFGDDIRDAELKDPVAVTWVVTFEYLKTQNSLITDALCLMSMFDAQAIPESLIFKPHEDASKSLLNDKVLGALQAYSMISQRNSSSVTHGEQSRIFDLHRLVRLAARNWLTMSGSYNYWTAEAISVITTNLQSTNVHQGWHNPEKYLRDIPHAMTVLSTQQLRLQGDHVFVPEPFIRQMFPKDYIERGVICPQCTGCLLIELSRRYRVYGDDTRALSVALKAATIFNHVFGEDDEFSLYSRYKEAVVLRALKDPHHSELVFREILATRTSMLAFRQLELDSMYGLAENLDHLREHVEAESLYS